MPFPKSPSHPLTDVGVERRFLGVSRHAGTGYAKRPGEVWLVLHEDWTGVWRVDPRDGRTVHLERALEGDRRADAARWAVETFAITEVERADARVLSPANHSGATTSRRARG